eukprot:m.126947 g.126947  ORF g.126947 m.126947 type:complete len:1367 (+) comp37918_c0_seq20:87-4187(+)
MAMAVILMFSLTLLMASVLTSQSEAPKKRANPDACVLPNKAALLPFGEHEGDQIRKHGSQDPITLNLTTESFPFYAQVYRTMTVHFDGLLTMNKTRPAERIIGMPYRHVPLVAVFWTELGLSKNGRLLARIERRAEQLKKASRNVRRAFPSLGKAFNATWMAVATWEKVVSYAKRNEKGLTNTFQCVIVSNCSVSFIHFIYPRNRLHWQPSDQRMTSATPYPLAGMSDPDGIRCHQLPASGTEKVKSLTETTNVGIPGVWIYRMDGPEVVQPVMKDVNECEMDPCHNGGTCSSNDVGQYSCSCLKGVEGTCCEKDFDECLSNPCRNGGGCIDRPGFFSCICQTGFGGSLCELNYCGNGIVEDWEECDDGNLSPYDGCSEKCTVERLWSCQQGNHLGGKSVCNSKPLDFSKSDPDTTGHVAVYAWGQAHAFLIDPAQLDIGDIQDTGWETVRIQAKNLKYAWIEELRFVPDRAHSYRRLMLPNDEIHALEMSVDKMYGSFNKEEPNSVSLILNRKSGLAVNLTNVFISLAYYYDDMWPDHDKRFIYIDVKLSSGHWTPPSKVTLFYVGENLHSPKIYVPDDDTNLLENSSKPVLIGRGELTVEDSDFNYFTIKLATVSITRKTELHLKEELSINAISDSVIFMFDSQRLILFLNGSATVEHYSYLLQNVLYFSRAKEFSGAPRRPVLFRVSDGKLKGKTLTYVNLVNVNNAPVLQLASGCDSVLVTFFEGSPPLHLPSRIESFDQDGDDLLKARVVLEKAEYGDTVNVNESLLGKLSLSRPSQWELVIAGKAGTDIYTEVLSSISFVNPFSNGTLIQKRFVVTVFDESSESNPFSVEVFVLTVNDPPVMSFHSHNGPLSEFFESRVRTITVNPTKPTYLFPPTLSFSDIDGRMASSVRMRLNNAVDGLAEEIIIDGALLAEFDLEQSSDWTNSTTYELAIKGQNFYEVFTEIMMSARYVHSGGVPSPGRRVVMTMGADNLKLAGLPVTVNLDVQAPNRPPQLNFGSGFGVGKGLTMDFSDESIRAIRLASKSDRIEIVDQDSSVLFSVTVELKQVTKEIPLDEGEFVYLFGDLPSSLTLSSAPDGNSLKISGPTTIADFVIALQGLHYAFTGDDPSSSHKFVRHIELVLTDVADDRDFPSASSKLIITIRSKDCSCSSAGQFCEKENGSSQIDEPNEEEATDVSDREIHMITRAPDVHHIQVFGPGFGVQTKSKHGTYINIQFSQEVSQPPVGKRTDLHKVLTLAPLALARARKIGYWEDAKTLIIFFPTAGTTVHKKDMLVTFLVSGGGCGTPSACRHSICHAHRASCPVSGVYRVGVYGRFDDMTDSTPLSLYWFTVVLVNSCLLIVTVYMVVAVGWVRVKHGKR